MFTENSNLTKQYKNFIRHIFTQLRPDKTSKNLNPFFFNFFFLNNIVRNSYNSIFGAQV